MKTKREQSLGVESRAVPSQLVDKVGVVRQRRNGTRTDKKERGAAISDKERTRESKRWNLMINEKRERGRGRI